MKIIAILEDSIATGGEFCQALNAILQMERICEGISEFEVCTLHSENCRLLDKLGISSRLIKYSIVDKLIALSSSSSVLQFILTGLNMTGPFENKLRKRGADLVYFISQTSSSNKLQKLNFINTVVDLCHRDWPEFPEVKMLGNFYWREQHLKQNLAPSLVVLTASDRLSDQISMRYGIDRDRLLSMPFSGNPLLKADFAEDSRLVLNKYGLKDGYFFYPAQFWAHKNHICILESLIILRSKGLEYNVVFAGGDKGNQLHLESFVVRHSLENQVRFLGFVPTEHMRGLYEGCLAVVMPTYFGPTNLPPLEAWMIGKPLIYSSHLIDDVGEAALCINPDLPEELVEAMMACEDPDKREVLVQAGHKRLKEIENRRTDAELKLKKILSLFSQRRKCWI